MSDIEEVVALDDDDDEEDDSRESSEIDEDEEGSGIEEENMDESTENERDATDEDSDDLEIQEVVSDASPSPDRASAMTKKSDLRTVVEKDPLKFQQSSRIVSSPDDKMEVDEIQTPAKSLQKLKPFIDTSTPSEPKEGSFTSERGTTVAAQSFTADLPPSPVMPQVENVRPKNILQTAKFDIRVSSVLNKATKQHGKMFMLDGKEETHWSSDQGSTQFVSFFFQIPQKISHFKIQFQGGFAAQSIRLIIETDDPQTGFSETFYPKDSLQIQHFDLKRKVDSMVSALFIFEESSDFFGRIVVYKLEIFE